MKTLTTLEDRRRFLISLTTGGILAPAVLMGSDLRAGTPLPFEVRPAPRYYPKTSHVPDVSISGKVAIITGASRGIGLAVGLALQAMGTQVIGTSRTPSAYSGHPFPLLELDLADPVSIQGLVSGVLARPEVQGAGGVDILVNNAGRGVIGGVVPVDPNMYFSGLQTGMATLYGGHVGVTSGLLPLLAARAVSGYARIMFTTSVQAYLEGGVDIGITFGHGYTSGKRALLSYANDLRKTLSAAGLAIKVSTLNPLRVNTDIVSGARPIFLQPVDANGNAIGDPNFQFVIDSARALFANGMPASYTAGAYTQLLTAAEPEANVIVGSDVEPYASQGATGFFLNTRTEEMRQSALPWIAGPSNKK